MTKCDTRARECDILPAQTSTQAKADNVGKFESGTERHQQEPAFRKNTFRNRFLGLDPLTMHSAVFGVSFAIPIEIATKY